MDQVGHEQPDTLLRIYAQVMQRDRAKIGWALDALMAGAARGTRVPRLGRRMGRRTTKPATGTSRRVGTHCEISRTSRDFLEAADGTRTHDLLHGKQRRRSQRPTTEDDESRVVARLFTATTLLLRYPL